MKARKLMLLFVLPVLFSGKAMSSGWTDSALFIQKVFIENKGQFDGEDMQKDKRIQFGLVNQGTGIYFTSSGLSYCYNEFKKMSREEWEKKEKGDKEGADRVKEVFEPKRHVVHMEWVGANPDARIIADEKVLHYFTYVDNKDLSGRSSLKAGAFKKITYKNIYPNIDVEYVIPEGKPGIKYSLILHPGADASLIKMKYSDEKNLTLDEKGNLQIETSFGTVVDHSPVTYYADNNQNIHSFFSLKNNIVSFSLQAPYSRLRTIIIDPWTTVPVFTSFNSAYDIDFDLKGNVYVYGGAQPFQEIKFNSAGVIQWVFTHPVVAPYWFGSFYGDFAVDHNSGSSYIAQGVGSAGATKVAKLNAAGGVVGYYMGDPDMDEIWKIAINNCTHQAIVGTANHNSANPSQAAMLDTNMVAMTFVNVLSATSSGNDPNFLAIDDLNNCYMAIARSVTGGTFDNMMLKFPANTFFPTAWMVFNGYTFRELLSVTYVNNQVQGANGFNGMAVNGNFLYTYDGATLKKWNKNTGALLLNNSVTFTSFDWGGLDVDECDNIYVGGPSWVKHYDVNLGIVNTIPVTSDVYDIKVGPLNKLYVCGKGFVSELQITSSTCSQINLTTSATGTSCTATTGSATVTATGGTPPYTYVWNPSGQTSQTATGLSSGTYIVTVIDNSCNPKMQADTVVVPAVGGFSVTSTQTNVSCNGGNNGSGSVTASGGSAPYTYSWSPSGGTNASASGLNAGNYLVTITDNTGCIQTASVSISQPLALTTTMSSTPATCGSSNGTAAVAAAGGTGSYTYLWNPSSAATAAVSGLSGGSYSVTVTDANGCTAVNTVSVASTGNITATAGPNSTVCAGQPFTMNASGGNTYSWSTGATTSSVTATATATGTYTVIVSSGSCADTAFVTVTVNASPVISVNGNTVLCVGDAATLTASGGTNYSWNTGSTAATITVSPGTTTTYSVSSSNALCTSTTSITVVVAPPPNAAANSITICAGQAALLTASGGATYSWNTGATTSSITAAASATATYTVIVSNGSCADTATATVTVNPNPTASAWSSVTITEGQAATLSASGGSTYLWSNGSASTAITVTPTVTTLYCVTVSNGSCTDTACVFVYVEPIDCSFNDDQLFVPDAFSPNYDTKNDVLGIYFPNLSCIKEFKFIVYDRWGEKVFEATNVTATWDGTYKGTMMNSAVFVYYMKVTFITGNEVIRKGNVSLIR